MEEKLIRSAEDMYIQYPTSVAEMQVPANTTIVPVDRRINKRLKTLTVSVPENGIMEIVNNNVTRFFFSNESGTLEFPNGVYMEDMVITLTNTDASNPARFNYKMIFAA